MEQYWNLIFVCAYFSVLRECDASEFRCNSGQCIKISDRCNLKADCVDGSDEMNCG